MRDHVGVSDICYRVRRGYGRSESCWCLLLLAVSDICYSVSS
jgi:hypothetical protein